jgi:hypothetical protein
MESIQHSRSQERPSKSKLSTEKSATQLRCPKAKDKAPASKKSLPEVERPGHLYSEVSIQK